MHFIINQSEKARKTLLQEDFSHSWQQCEEVLYVMLSRVFSMGDIASPLAGTLAFDVSLYPEKWDKEIAVIEIFPHRRAVLS